MKHLETLEDCLSWIEQLHHTEIELGLSRVKQVAARLALLSPASKVITIAGTNGKGSATAMLEALALQLNMSVACYTSPHIFEFNERIRINGQNVADADIVAALKQIESARGDISLTYFEYTTLAALLIFNNSQPDLMVLEVGLGGRLDAVNIIDADISVITSIGLDHQDWLGNTREQIAKEKLGVLRGHQKVFVTESAPPDNMAQLLADSGAHVASLHREVKVQLVSDELATQLASGYRCVLPIPKNLSIESYLTAFQVAEFLGVDIASIDANALAETRLIGRFHSEVFQGKHLLFDVAHNPAAIERLVERLTHDYSDKAVSICYATMADKDYLSVVTQLNRLQPSCWYLPSLDVPRALSAENLHSTILKVEPAANCELTSIKTAIERVSENQYLLICGSFYTVAAGLGLIKNVKG